MADSRLVATALGDSITAGTPLWDPDPDVRTRIGEKLDPQSQWTYWAAKREPRLEFRNCGVDGEETEEIARRLEEAAAGADALIVQGGVNDLVHGKSLERAAENLYAMTRRGKELGLKVAIVELIPCNGYPAIEQRIRDLNATIGALAEDEAVPLVPFYSTLEDSRRPGRIRSEWTDDGNHPSVVGQRRLGDAVVESLRLAGFL